MPQGTRHPVTLLMEHIIGTMLHIWWRMSRIGLIAGLTVGLMTEIVGGIITHHFPTGMTHLTAAALGLAAAYAAAATTLASEILLGLVHTLRVIEGDADAGVLAAEAIARHETRAVAHDLGSLLGFRRASAAAAPAVRHPLEAFNARPPDSARPPVPVRPLATTRGPNAPFAATDAFTASLPPQLPPLPVRADQLPRIAWANEPDSPAALPAAPGGTSSGPSPYPAAGDHASGGRPGSPSLLEHATPHLAPLAAIGASIIAGAAEHHMLRGPEESHQPVVQPVAQVTPTPVTPSAVIPAQSSASEQTVPVSATSVDSAESMPESPPLATDAAPTHPRAETPASGIAPTVIPTLTEVHSATAAPAPFGPVNPDEGAPIDTPEDMPEDTPLVPPLAMPTQPRDGGSPSSAVNTSVDPSGQPTAQSEAEESPGVSALPALPFSIEDGPPTVPRAGAPARPTRPLAPITSPLASPNSDPLTPPTGSGNLWDRLSRALMGIPPISEGHVEAQDEPPVTEDP